MCQDILVQYIIDHKKIGHKYFEKYGVFDGCFSSSINIYIVDWCIIWLLR